MKLPLIKKAKTVDSILASFTKSLDDLKSFIAGEVLLVLAEKKEADALFENVAIRQTQIDRAYQVHDNIASLIHPPTPAPDGPWTVPTKIHDIGELPYVVVEDQKNV